MKQENKDDAQQFINEEGDFIGGGDDGQDMMDDFGGGGDDPFDGLPHQDNPQVEMEVGFEEAGLQVHGFANYNPEKAQKNLKSMFQVHNSKRFDAAGGTDQKIELN